MLSSTGERPTPCRPGTSVLHVVTADPDAVMARAVALGAPVVHELVDQVDHPSRDFTIADPDGNHWTFATFAGYPVGRVRVIRLGSGLRHGRGIKEAWS